MSEYEPNSLGQPKARTHKWLRLSSFTGNVKRLIESNDLAPTSFVLYDLDDWYDDLTELIKDAWRRDDLGPCTWCGKDMEVKGAKYCPRCGQRIEEEEA